MRTSDIEARARKSFEEQTAEHALTILHEDGLYRHLSFAKPGTNVYRYDLVTWPGYLAVSGDMGEYVFSRIEDMFKFFAGEGKGEGINPGYWGEKLRGPGTDMYRRYSEDAFKRHVTEWRDHQIEDGDMEGWRQTLEAQQVGPLIDAIVIKAEAEFRQAVDDSLLTCEAYDMHTAMTLIQDFEHRGIRIEDYWEWPDSLKDYDYSYLWVCWGIKRGIQRYYALKKSMEAQGAGSGPHRELAT